MLADLLPLMVSCGGAFSSCTDEVTFSLPQNELSGGGLSEFRLWHVVLTCAGECVQTDVPFSSETVSFELEKNCVYAVSAFPVTADGYSGAAGFLPAGCVYPYQKQLSFLHGFSASVLSDFYTHTVSAGVSAHDSREYAARFNWKKFCETLQQKHDGAKAALPYNPWLLDKERILSGISAGTFSAAYLGQNGCVAVPEAEIRAAIEKHRAFLCQNCTVTQDEPYSLFSLYLPHNQQSEEEKLFVLKYGVSEKLLCRFSEGQNCLVFVTVEKGGKITLAIHSISIYT